MRSLTLPINEYFENIFAAPGPHSNNVKQFQELIALSPPVLPASAHKIEELMNAADEKSAMRC
jgi:hypothetical protein